MQCIDPTTVKALSPAMATLSSLRYLHLRASVDAETPSVLSGAFAALPNLHDLVLVLSCGQNMRKRKRDVVAPVCCLAAMLSTATALTSLSVQGTDETGHTALSAFAPLRLPALVQLSIAMLVPAALSQFLSHLSAPLTQLHLLHSKYSRYHAATAEHVQHLFSRLSQFALLQSPTDAIESDETIRGTVQLHAAPAIAVLRHLQHLHLAACMTTVSQTLQGPCVQAAQGKSPLTSLVLCCQSSGPSSAELDLWPQCTQRLGRLHLQHLDLLMTGSRQCSNHSLAPLLKCLTALTALRVRDWDCIHSSADAAALGTMTRLRRLHLLGMNVPAELLKPSAHALLRLSNLTNLAFIIADKALNAVFTKALACVAPICDWWPALQQLGLKLALERDNSGIVVEFVRVLRTRSEFKLHLECPHRFDKDSGHAFADVLDVEVRYVEAAARRAGVPVTIGHEVPF